MPKGENELNIGPALNRVWTIFIATGYSGVQFKLKPCPTKESFAAKFNLVIIDICGQIIKSTAWVLHCRKIDWIVWKCIVRVGLMSYKSFLPGYSMCSTSTVPKQFLKCLKKVMGYLLHLILLQQVAPDTPPLIPPQNRGFVSITLSTSL